MKIEYLTQHLEDPRTFLYLERYVTEGSRTYSPFAHQSEGDPKYHPASDTDSFEIPCLKIPKEKIIIYLDNPNAKLLTNYIQKDVVLFPVHPEIFEDDNIAFVKELRKYPSTSIWVAPTASTRTVMTMAKTKHLSPHFIKLHYPRRISRFIRRLRTNNIQNSIETSKDLREFAPPKFGFLPETIGMAYGSDPEAWGFIIREMIPRPVREEKHFLIPLFALYSQDLKNPEDVPFLVQLIQFLHEDPLTFTLNHIMKPIIQIWCTALRERGILFEMHGQNLLLELDTQFFPSRMIYRDLDVYVDQEIRKKHQLHMHFPKSHLITSDRESIFSLKYDAFIGHHLFDYLASLLDQFYGIGPKSLQESCKKTFHQFFPDADLYFTDKTFYYSNEIFPGNKYKIIETNDLPKWR